MSVTASFNLDLKADEVLALGLDNVTDPTLRHAVVTSGTLTGSTSVPSTKAFSDQRSLAAGTDTLDLTALVGALSSAIDMTGLKVQLVKIVAAIANTEDIVIADTAATGYFIFGDASGQVTLPPGGSIMLFGNEGLPDVGAGAKDIDVTSSDLDAIYDIIIVAG